LRFGRAVPRGSAARRWTHGAPGLAALLAAAIFAVGGAQRAWSAEPASADTSLHRFLDSLADSTDRYFGLITAPVDTAGLDSTLEARLERPWSGPRRRMGLSLRPFYRFLRVDGSLWAGSATVSDRREHARLRGDLGYADGSNTWLGGGELSVALNGDRVAIGGRVAAYLEGTITLPN